MTHREVPPILVVAGYSDSGKTTLIERLVPELRRRGLRVGVVKHLGSHFDLDSPGKDTHRFWESGADSVGVLAPDRTLVMWRDANADLKALASLMPVDLVLAEGFKSGSGPRILVTGGRADAGAQWGRGREVIAAVGGAEAEGPWPAHSPDDIAGVADRVEAWLLSLRDAR
ncbi:MAG: molybdopterin-guanine dinucleotide biosynthesis protein B [Anaerolineae bacterium]|nr:molybdopterin-guanine dinucleotide biosynthesis protein B [Anaerolineae bacterium]